LVLLKRSIRGTPIPVSRTHLPNHLGEFEFHWSLRRAPETSSISASKSFHVPREGMFIAETVELARLASLF
jgi:hypothetical protein